MPHLPQNEVVVASLILLTIRSFRVSKNNECVFQFFSFESLTHFLLKHDEQKQNSAAWHLDRSTPS